MGSHDNTKASPSAVKNSQLMWENFMKISAVCGIATSFILILMALFLV